jgi:hypothetical protein
MTSKYGRFVEERGEKIAELVKRWLYFKPYRFSKNQNRNRGSDGRRYRLEVNFWYGIKSKDNLPMPMAQAMMTLTRHT